MATGSSDRRVCRDALMAATRRLLTQGQSFADTPIQRICDEAGISRWRFYQHFTSRHDLLHSWFADLDTEFERTHDTWLQLGADCTEADLRDAVADLYLPYALHGPLHAAMYDAAVADATIRAEIDSLENRRIVQLADHISRGQSAGWVASNLTAEPTAAWIVYTGSRGYQRLVASADAELTIDAFIDAYAAFVWRVLYAPVRRSASDGARER